MVIHIDQKMNISHYLFLIFWLMKPFYFFQSGTVQPSDAVFLFAFVVWLFEERGEVKLEKGNHLFVLFILSVLFVNFIYTLIYLDKVFLEKSLFYIYSMLIVISFQKMATNDRFLKALLWITIINIIFQLFVFGLKLGGRLYGGYRYMGTFNDPNQFSFFLFSSFLLIFVLLSYLNRQKNPHTQAGKYFLFAVVIFLIFQGSSTGAFLGIMGFALSIFLAFSTKDNGPWRVVLRLFFIGFIILSVLILIATLTSPSLLGSKVQSENFLIQRIVEKIDKFASGGLFTILDDRQVSRVYYFPQNLFYGAGEGLYGRFVLSEPLEIHSTIIALWFYYGLIPIVLLGSWIKTKLTGIPKSLYPVFIGLLLESMMLANQRQPVLWILIILGDISSLKLCPDKKHGLIRKI